MRAWPGAARWRCWSIAVRPRPSEIFAAAIQDYGRGLIIGEPTFGKGTVQNLIDLDRFSQDTRSRTFGELKMTIQEFFRINGGSTQLKGVTPDIAVSRRAATTRTSASRPTTTR